MEKKSSKKKEITHWSHKEELNYYFFLICKADELSSVRNKPQGFYVEMSRYIDSRDKVQCRSHHEKMVAKVKNKAETQPDDIELQNLRAFYRDHYSLRLLDSQHLIKEIEHQLAQKVSKGTINKKLYHEFREKACRNLPLLEVEPELSDSESLEEKPEAPSGETDPFSMDEEKMKEEAEMIAESLEHLSLKENSEISAFLQLEHTAPRTFEDFDRIFEEEE